MSILKTVKKYAKKATKATGKRYGISYGRRGLRMSKSSLSRIDRDVQMIKSRLNVEKKFHDSSITTASVGQSDGSATGGGFYALDITPQMSQGVGETQRVGNSLKLTGYHQKLQFAGQANCYSDRRMKIMLVRTQSNDTASVILDDLFDPNPLTGYRDYHSNRNYSNNNRAHKILMTKYKTIKASTAVTTNTTWPMIGDCALTMKMAELLRFEGNATNSPKDVRYFMYILMDTGNRHPSTITTNNGVLINNIQTGLELQTHYRWWYVDN